MKEEFKIAEEALWKVIEKEHSNYDVCVEYYLEELDLAKALEKQAISMGYSEAHAQNLRLFKLRNYGKNKGMGTLPMGRILSFTKLLKAVKEWYQLEKEEQGAILWELGFNTNKFQWFFEVGCFKESAESEAECGVYVYGSERTDKEWITLVVDGVNVASMEARTRDYFR